MKKTHKALFGMLAIGALTVSSCATNTADGSAETNDGELEAVTLMLNWYPYGEHAPFYYGVEEGIFAEHGIDLSIEAGQGSTQTAQATGQGHVDFGWADTPAVLANIDKGVSVKSMGVFLQTTPSAVQVFESSGIESVSDLQGKTIAVSAGDAPTTTFPLFLEAAGLTEDDVKQENLDSAGKMAAALSGKVDGLIGFAHDQGPTLAHERDESMTYLRYADQGVNFYSNGLIASEDTLSENTAVAKNMMEATAEAFEAAIENPEEAASAMEGKDPQIPDQEIVLEQWTETTNLLSTEHTEGSAPGTNDPADWEATIAVLSDAGLIDSGRDTTEYFDDQFQPE